MRTKNPFSMISLYGSLCSTFPCSVITEKSAVKESIPDPSDLPVLGCSSVFSSCFSFVFQNISILPHGRFFGLSPGISIDLPWGRYGYFWNRTLSYCFVVKLCYCYFNLDLFAPVDNEDAPDQHDVQEMLKVEEHAVVLALRDTYMPGLDGSDAVMFATLLADLFPNVQVPNVLFRVGYLSQA